MIFSVLILTSCSMFEPVPELGVTDKMYNCVLELVGKHGAKANEATESCKAVYKGE